MPAPPNELDGARVLWWAWSGEEPFGELFGAQDEDRYVYGFAVCTYDNEQFYRFSCSGSWDVVQDSVHDTEEEAKVSIPTNYDASKVRWSRFARREKSGH